MQTGIIIPVLLRKETPLRTQNFLHTLYAIECVGLKDHCVVVLQKTPTSIQLNDLFNVITIETEDELIHKSKLVNEGVRYHLERGKQFALMIDSDIHFRILDVMNRMESEDASQIGGIKPFQWFFRLDPEQSAKVKNGESISVPSSTEKVDYPAAGAWGFSIEAWSDLGGMDEGYTGWGWEDCDFSVRMRSQRPWKNYPGVGFHLDHENDRQFNDANLTLFNKSV